MRVRIRKQAEGRIQENGRETTRRRRGMANRGEDRMDGNGDQESETGRQWLRGGRGVGPIQADLGSRAGAEGCLVELVKLCGATRCAIGGWWD